jgi:hypothetical protein
MSALVSTSCAAALDLFPLVEGMNVHSDHHQIGPLCSFLGLFAPVHAQDVQIRNTAHMVLPAELFTLGTVLQHHPHATLAERIATLRFAQRRKIALKIFLEGCRLSRICQSPDHNSSEFHLIIHSDQMKQAQQSLRLELSFFSVFLPSFP